MNIALKILWKTPVVIGASVLGFIAANQAGWSFKYLMLHDEGIIGDNITYLITLAAGLISAAMLWSVWRLASPVLWILVPVMAWTCVVGGAWNGFARIGTPSASSNRRKIADPFLGRTAKPATGSDHASEKETR